MLKLKIRAPELILGVLLTIAIFAVGMLFSASQNPNNYSAPRKEYANAQTNRILKSADDRIADYTLALDVLTFVLAAATIGLGIISAIGIYFQSRDTRILQRAYLAVEGHGVLPLSGFQESVAEIGVKNVGNLPAREVRWFIDVSVDTSGTRTDFPIDETKFYGGTNVIPPGTEMKRSQYFRKTKTEIFSPPGKSLYVWGEIRYTDGFGAHRVTKFCQRYPVDRVVSIQNSQGTNSSLPASAMRYHRYGNDAD